MRDLPERVARILLAVGTRPLAIAFVVAIAVFAALGALEFHGASLALFDLDGEGKPPAIYSALLDVAAGLLAIAMGGLENSRAWTLLGAFLLVMGADDLITLHEHLQSATGVDWQLLYLPVVLVGGIVWLMVFRDVWRRSVAVPVLMAAGAAAWVLAQLCEIVEYDNGSQVAAYPTFATIEEALEMAGTSLFVLAFLAALRLPAVHQRLTQP